MRITTECPLLPCIYFIWWQKRTVFGFELNEESMSLAPIMTLYTVKRKHLILPWTAFDFWKVTINQILA